MRFQSMQAGLWSMTLTAVCSIQGKKAAVARTVLQDINV
jgi:hypothetical protein